MIYFNNFVTFIIKVYFYAWSLFNFNKIITHIDLFHDEKYYTPDTHWRGKKMQPVQLCILWSRQFEDKFENPQWRKVAQMLPVWSCILSGRQLEGSFHSLIEFVILVWILIEFNIWVGIIWYYLVLFWYYLRCWYGFW